MYLRCTHLPAGSAASFRPQSLYGAATLDDYYSMLNIIGERMRRYPNDVDRKSETEAKTASPS